MLFSGASWLRVGSSLLLSGADELASVFCVFPREVKFALGEPVENLPVDRTHLEQVLTRCLEVKISSMFERKLCNILQHFADVNAATLLAARHALSHGIGINIGGGFHHATLDWRDARNGCWINDIVSAIKTLERRAWVIDLDFHAAGGTLQCFINESVDQRYFKAIFDLTNSKLGGELSDFKKIEHIVKKEYYCFTGANDLRAETDALVKHFCRSLRSAGETVEIVFYNAGADVTDPRFAKDQALSIYDVFHRDKAVIDACFACQVPLVITLGGGYNSDAYHCWNNLIGYCKKVYLET